MATVSMSSPPPHDLARAGPAEDFYEVKVAIPTTNSGPEFRDLCQIFLRDRAVVQKEKLRPDRLQFLQSSFNAKQKNRREEQSLYMAVAILGTCTLGLFAMAAGFTDSTDTMIVFIVATALAAIGTGIYAKRYRANIAQKALNHFNHVVTFASASGNETLSLTLKDWFLAYRNATPEGDTLFVRKATVVSAPTPASPTETRPPAKRPPAKKVTAKPKTKAKSTLVVTLGPAPVVTRAISSARPKRK